MHGYDVCDPHAINPQIGTELELMQIVNELKKRNMGWLQDIVPNHMAFDSHNPQLMDVLERGKFSEYASHFDIDWDHPDPELRGKLLVPFLADTLEECINRHEIKIKFDDSGFVVHYFNNSWPVSISGYSLLLPVIHESYSRVGKQVTEQLIQQLDDLEDFAASGVDSKEWQATKEHWLIQVNENPELKKTIEENIDNVNRDSPWFKEILDKQFYQLAHWRTTEKKIDYRRFFTVNGLICLRMEHRKVFEEYHQYILALYKEGYFQGLRIDHIDGLYDPATYIQRLRKAVGPDCYIISEKILAPDEELPSDWQLQGTSGYEFLSHINRLFTDGVGASKLVGYYKRAIGITRNYEDIVFEKKKYILFNHMRGELDNLLHYLYELNLLPKQEIDDSEIEDSLASFMAAFPVYRIYPDAFPLEEIEMVQQAFQFALAKNPANKKSLEWIRSFFEWKNKSIEEETGEMLFLKRLMQFTGPLAAKGVEDTTFYFYNPLISHNEVGDAPSKLAMGVSAFHKQMLSRHEKTPFSLNATSTHDTKRGEDARIRINILSEMWDEWLKAVEEWIQTNAQFKKTINGKPVPGLNEEYFIYQSLVGAFPSNLSPNEEDIKRLKDYVQKFLREEKQFTDWTEPDESYEEACFTFIEQLFRKENSFLESFVRFEQKVLACASINSLAQVLIKITAPGIPDIYQGTELWDLSYVDPDNRRPVDYQKRISFLDSIQKLEKLRDHTQLMSLLSENRREGIEKLYVLYKSLQLRKNHPDLFHYGEYIPLTVVGAGNEALAFARRWKNEWAITVIPLNVVQKMNKGHETIDPSSWEGIKLQLPASAPSVWQSVFSGEIIRSGEELSLHELFASLPVAVLWGSVVV
jgi:(1->4)-alpha-D-glucan 1-alpha-D-glucosylmutase